MVKWLNALRRGSIVGGRRYLHLHEYQSKELLYNAGMNTQRFVVASTPSEAVQFASNTLKDVQEYVIKAQILAGGRGKGHFSSGLQGGVQLVKRMEQVQRVAELMLGHQLVTHQTGPDGIVVRKVMVAEAKDLAKETYLAMVLDRSAKGPVLMGSPCGGMDIELVAQRTPHLLFKEPIDPISGPTTVQLERLARQLGLADTPQILQQAITQMRHLYQLFVASDATLIEINPFGVTPAGEVLCFDAKIQFDDNAQFRQQHIFSLADPSETDARELIAHQHNLNYISMEGNIGCLVNGAGLAMATMDLLQLHGGRPANFLDVGGSAQPAHISAAFRLLLNDPNVKSIFVNIFGGIMRCDLIAEGILSAIKDAGSSEASCSMPKDTRPIPLTLRLAGTNEDVAKARLLEEYPYPVHLCNDLDLAAQSAIRSVTASSSKAQDRA